MPGIQVTILADADLSDAARIPHGCYIEAIQCPVTFDDGAGDLGWTTAGISFVVAKDGGASFKPLDDEDGEVTYPAGLDRMLWLDTHRHRITGVVKIQSGTSASKVTQLNHDRVVTLYFRQQPGGAGVD
jgi:hypothetical protein